MSYVWYIRNWITQYLRPKLRKTKMIALMYSFAKPVENLFAGEFDGSGNLLKDGFLQLKNNIDLRMRYNSQQKSLSALLNKLFDSTLQRISIQTTADMRVDLYARNGDETIPGYVKKYSRNGSETLPNHAKIYTINSSELDLLVDFIVNVPSAISSKEPEIKAWVNYYKFGGLNFKINYT